MCAMGGGHRRHTRDGSNGGGGGGRWGCKEGWMLPPASSRRCALPTRALHRDRPAGAAEVCLACNTFIHGPSPIPWREISSVVPIHVPSAFVRAQSGWVASAGGLRRAGQRGPSGLQSSSPRSSAMTGWSLSPCLSRRARGALSRRVRWPLRPFWWLFGLRSTYVTLFLSQKY
jgi:hypothetical protein